MQNDHRPYSSIVKNGPKTEGKVKIAFGEYPKVSGFEIVYSEGRKTFKYNFTGTGNLERDRRNDPNDLRTATDIAMAALRHIKDPVFVRQTLKDLSERKHSLSPNDIKALGDIITKRYGIHLNDEMTSKLMS